MELKYFLLKISCAFPRLRHGLSHSFPFLLAQKQENFEITQSESYTQLAAKIQKTQYIST